MHKVPCFIVTRTPNYRASIIWRREQHAHKARLHEQVLGSEEFAHTEIGIESNQR